MPAASGGKRLQQNRHALAPVALAHARQQRLDRADHRVLLVGQQRRIFLVRIPPRLFVPNVGSAQDEQPQLPFGHRWFALARTPLPQVSIGQRERIAGKDALDGRNRLEPELLADRFGLPAMDDPLFADVGNAGDKNQIAGGQCRLQVQIRIPLGPVRQRRGNLEQCNGENNRASMMHDSSLPVGIVLPVPSTTCCRCSAFRLGRHACLQPRPALDTHGLKTRATGLNSRDADAERQG